jgi:3-deoxy-D-manno-octulosonic-acid transferase
MWRLSQHAAARYGPPNLQFSTAPMADSRPKRDSARLIDRAAGRMAAGYISLVYNTSTPPPMWDEYIDTFRGLHPFILAVWHGQFMLLPALPREDIPAKVMLALHRDAELMAVALHRHDLELIRGAGAGIKGRDRGGANAFRSAVTALAQGYTVAMTADVPPGPARRVGNGIITLARVTGRPILPVALASSHYVSLNTWSRMTINLPFSRLGGSIGDPIVVPPELDDAQLEHYRSLVERQLDIATADAYGRAGVSALRATPAQAMEAGMVKPGLGLKLYRGVTKLARPLLPTLLARRAKRGKEDPARRDERFGIASHPRPSGRLAWLHAASVGETNTILPVIEELQRRRPGLGILLTTGTVTSADIAAARLADGAVHQYLPLDVPAYVGRFLDHWKPDLGVFIESEIWPNLILAAAMRDVPMALVNGRLSKESFKRWRKRPGMALPLFSRFRVTLAQNKLYALRLAQLGAPNVVASGNIKVDAPPPAVDDVLLASLSADIGMRPVWLAASTHADEETLVATAHREIARACPGVLTIIAPRHPERCDSIVADLQSSSVTVQRLSAGKVLGAKVDILLVDRLGQLGTMFRLAPVTFMGKSLSREGGGHNPIEPVRLGSAVVTGPAWGNFEDEFKALLMAKGAIEVKAAVDLAPVIARLLTSPDEMASVRRNADLALIGLSGALGQSVDALLALLPMPDARPAVAVEAGHARA